MRGCGPQRPRTAPSGAGGGHWLRSPWGVPKIGVPHGEASGQQLAMPVPSGHPSRTPAVTAALCPRVCPPSRSRCSSANFVTPLPTHTPVIFAGLRRPHGSVQGSVSVLMGSPGSLRVRGGQWESPHHSSPWALSHPLMLTAGGCPPTLRARGCPVGASAPAHPRVDTPSPPWVYSCTQDLGILPWLAPGRAKTSLWPFSFVSICAKLSQKPSARGFRLAPRACRNTREIRPLAPGL